MGKEEGSFSILRWKTFVSEREGEGEKRKTPFLHFRFLRSSLFFYAVSEILKTVLYSRIESEVLHLGRPPFSFI